MTASLPKGLIPRSDIPAPSVGSWQKVPLGNILAERKEKVSPKRGDERPYVALEHMPSRGTRLIGHGEAGSAVSDKTAFRQGDVLFGKLRPNLRKCLRAPFDGICSTDILALYPRAMVDAGYAAHLLRSEQVMQYAENTAIGTKMPRTSWTHLAALEILLPPLPEQRRIAEILTGVDDAIDVTRAVIDQTRKVKAALLQDLLSNGLPGRHTKFKTVKHLGRIPAEWEMVRLGDLVVDGGLQTGPFGGQLHASDYTSAGIPVVMPVNMRNGKIDTTEIARVSPDHVERLRQHRLRAGDIVFARRGDIGRCALVTASQEGWLCGTGCLRGRPSYGLVSEYLLHYLGQELVIQWLNDNAVGQTMLNLSTAILAALPIALPTNEEQRVIGNAIVLLEEQIAQQRNWLSGLQCSKGALSQTLLAGNNKTGMAIPTEEPT